MKTRFDEATESVESLADTIVYFTSTNNGRPVKREEVVKFLNEVLEEDEQKYYLITENGGYRRFWITGITTNKRKADKWVKEHNKEEPGLFQVDEVDEIDKVEVEDY